MCGIAAYFGPGIFDPEPLLRTLAHRGPDSHGVYSMDAGDGNRLHLIHTRLSILDLKPTGNQPMLLTALGEKCWRTVAGLSEVSTGAASGRVDYAIAYNGEIFNFIEIRAELQACGHVFTSSGDTEVLLRGYAQWGQAVFAKLDGMFAAVIYDGPARRLVVARDHAGIKPLYYGRSRDGGYLFASEVRTILGCGRWEGRINRAAILDYLRFGSFQEPATAFAGIWAFESGCAGWISLDDGVPGILRSENYWDIERAGLADDHKRNWRAEHGEILRRTVAEQLIADVPVGVFLSGGVDSTLLLEMAAEAARDRMTAFTVGGDLTTNDEADTAVHTARNLGVKHLLVRLTGAEQSEWIMQSLQAMDQPSCDGVNTYVVSRAARAAGLTVALSGTGADELHGAYGHARNLAGLIRLIRRFGPLARPFGHVVTNCVRATNGVIAGERLQAMLMQSHSPWRMLQEKRRFFTESQIAELWVEGSTMPVRWHSPVFDEAQLARLADENQIMIAEVRGYLLNTLLRDCDWATMANHQELRVPFLGRRYTEFMLRMPLAFTDPVGSIKKPLLAALISPANRALATLPKRGFTMNYAAMLLGPLRQPFHASCEWLNVHLGFRLDAAALLGGLNAADAGKVANRLWALFALGHYLSSHCHNSRVGSGSPSAVPRSGPVVNFREQLFAP